MIPASGGDDEPFAVYLDMNHWYAVGRASAGEPERPSDPEVLERLRMLRRDGRVVDPEGSKNSMPEVRGSSAGTEIRRSSRW